MTPDQQAREIASKLTEAQRDLLASLPQRPSRINVAQAQAVARKGLATLERHTLRVIATPLGEQVKRLLEEEQGHG